VNGYDRTHHRATTKLSFMVNRPSAEPGFYLDRQETADRRIHYSIRPYATQVPQDQHDE